MWVRIAGVCAVAAVALAGPALAQSQTKPTREKAAKPAPAPAAEAAPTPAAGPVDIRKAVQCQTLFLQYGERQAGSKVADDVKKAAGEKATAGSKACNDKKYDAGLDLVRQALTAIEVKPLS